MVEAVLTKERLISKLLAPDAGADGWSQAVPRDDRVDTPLQLAGPKGLAWLLNCKPEVGHGALVFRR